MRLTREQAAKMVLDVRRNNPNSIAGFAVLPKDTYASSNELYEEIGRSFEITLAELREKRLIPASGGGYGQTFFSYGFPHEIPNMEQLDCVFCYIDVISNQFRWRCTFRYITHDEIEYSTSFRIAYIPDNDRTIR